MEDTGSGLTLEFAVRTETAGLTLCWVGFDGTLHHFYALHRGVSHVESSHTGHAFVVR